ncbi:transcription factor [Ignicoccus pacificus DSM 13166]|uniref:Transcription factor E n=1 Tax=Ignicoccus pacificus DSM 13166 TaxID=940294 RepID=A0A977K9B1_9CREN|nr:transcription factor [Ignicoccus pacificus DSM 13166]
MNLKGLRLRYFRRVGVRRWWTLQKSQEELKKELFKFIEKLVGKDGLKVFRELMKYDSVSEDQIADDLGMKVNDVRKILYKLEEYGLVKNYKERSEDGMQMIYYWYIDREMLNRRLLRLKQQVLEKLKARLKKEEDETYFYCPRDLLRFSYSEAMLHDFTCPRCGTPLEMEEDNITKAILKKLIKKLEEEIKHEESVL